MTRSWKEQG